MNLSEYDRPTLIEIDLDRLGKNFHAAKKFIGPGKYMAVVKANAYGHGAVDCSRRLEAEGIDWFGVVEGDEAMELREAGIRSPILCFGGFPAGMEERLIEANVTAAVSSPEMIARTNSAAGRSKVTVPVHIKIDTGMGRMGCRFDAIDPILDELKNSTNIRVEGLMTHFAEADAADGEYTQVQIERFNEVRETFARAGIVPELVHMANSPGAAGHPDSRGNMVRLGGLLYGIEDILPPGVKVDGIETVFSLRTRITMLRTVPKGETIGYGRTFTAPRDTIIATIPIGYADGFRRDLSNKAFALVHGKRVPVAGRISMDWTMLDVTDVENVKVDDEVVLIGELGDERIGPEELAESIGTIAYELTCAIGSVVRRIYKGRRE